MLCVCQFSGQQYIKVQKRYFVNVWLIKWLLIIISMKTFEDYSEELKFKAQKREKKYPTDVKTSIQVRVVKKFYSYHIWPFNEMMN